MGVVWVGGVGGGVGWRRKIFLLQPHINGRAFILDARDCRSSSRRCSRSIVHNILLYEDIDVPLNKQQPRFTRLESCIQWPPHPPFQASFPRNFP
jgi:hypothetical protein